MTRRWNENDDTRYLELREQNMPEFRIAELMGFSRVCLRKQARRLDLPVRMKGRSSPEVRERKQRILADVGKGMSASEIAHKYGVSRARVNQIKKETEKVG